MSVACAIGTEITIVEENKDGSPAMYNSLVSGGVTSLSGSSGVLTGTVSSTVDSFRYINFHSNENCTGYSIRKSFEVNDSTPYRIIHRATLTREEVLVLLDYKTWI